MYSNSAVSATTQNKPIFCFDSDYNGKLRFYLRLRKTLNTVEYVTDPLGETGM